MISAEKEFIEKLLGSFWNCWKLEKRQEQIETIQLDSSPRSYDMISSMQGWMDPITGQETMLVHTDHNDGTRHLLPTLLPQPLLTLILDVVPIARTHGNFLLLPLWVSSSRSRVGQG